jgi:L-iditol 2-dehydrogenase
VRAIEFHGDERVELVDRPPLRPGRGELLLAPVAVGVCGTDVEIYEGSMTYYRAGVARYPVVPGHEWVADVIDIAEDVDQFRPGDRVVGECSVSCGRCTDCRNGSYHLCVDRTETGILNRDGAMATRMLFPARSAFAVPVNLSPSAAALVEPTAVALNAIRRVAVGGRTVLVLGAGAIGLLAAQCARADGAGAVLIGDPVHDRRAAAQQVGVDAVPPLTATVAEDAVSVREMTGDHGVDVAFVCAGAPDALALALETVRPGGSIVVVALFGRAQLPLDVDRLVVRDVALHGVLGSPNRWRDAIHLIAAGEVVTDALVGTPLSLTQIGEAMELVRGGVGSPVKVLIDPRKRT